MLPQSTDSSGSKHAGTQVEGRDAELIRCAIELYGRGWHPLPLGGDDGKKLLETQLSGYTPGDAAPEEIEVWPAKYGARWTNLGVRCPVGVLGIDVDDYIAHGKSKRGLATIAEHETHFGAELPATYITTAREGRSGIRWYRIPHDWRGPDILRTADGFAGNVELIQRTHRYGAVPPSIHYTGQPYRLHGPDGTVVLSGLLPPPGELPELPQAWLDGLAALCPTRALVGRGNREEIDLWLDAHTGNEYPHGLEQIVKTFESQINGGTAWRLAMLSALPWALKESRVGGYPARLAKLTFRQHPATVAAIAEKPSRAVDFDKLLASSIRYAEDDDHENRWLRMCRDYGTNTLDYAGMADAVQFRTESADQLGGVTVVASDVVPPSWSPVDMAAALAGGEELTTTVLARTDGVHLFYRGKVHSVHGESESGKTWLALCAVAECLTAGEPVLYVDFEDDAKGVGARLLLMGVPRAAVVDPALFVYVRPEAGLGAEAERKAFEHLLFGAYSLAVLDGVTESMGLFGLVGKDNDAVATWQRTLPNAIANRTGAAVVCIDHVTKDADSRGRFAIGGQQKMAGLSGAAFIVEPETPFVRGLAGQASVRVGKDRPGFLRAMGGEWRKGDRTQLVATFTLDSTDDGLTRWRFEPPDTDVATAGQTGDDSRRKWCMEQVSKYWEIQNPDADADPKSKALQKCSTTKTESAMVVEHKGAGISRDSWRAAIGALVVERYAFQIDGARKSKLHKVIRPYRESDDETPNSPQVPFQTVSQARYLGERGTDLGDASASE